MKDFMVEITRKAAKYLLDNFKKDPKLMLMRGVSKEIVTKHDRENDKFIIKEISENYPDHNILTEESGFIDNNSNFTWIVDSLDGSGNFAVGNPFFSISIALMRENELILSVINAPYLDEVFVSEKEKGAFLNDKQIHVSDYGDFDKSYILSCEGGEKTNKRIAKINSILHPKVNDLRKLGSAALEGAWVACGRAEGYITTSIYSWDVASAVLLVQEAGGKVTDFEGQIYKPRQSDTIFSNGRIHEQIIKLISSYPKI
jgi:myo-inositol-1(or 4)-monophosphatase